MKTHILSLIDAAYAGVNVNPRPSDFSSLVASVLQLEAMTELQALERMLKEDNVEDLFKERCKDRARLTQESVLSFAERPDGIINSLYWNMAVALFNPATMGEMLAILMPEVTEYIAPEYTLDTSMPLAHVGMRGLRISLTTSSIDMLTAPPTQRLLADLVVAGHRILDVKTIAGFNFPLHRTFHDTLVKTYPDLGGRLYKHNTGLRKLADQLSMLDDGVPTPSEAISRFIQQLRLANKKMGGKFRITFRAREAVAIFQDYLDSLPTAFRVQLMSLSDKKESLHQILCAGLDIEIVIRHLVRIINNPLNFAFLSNRPSVPDKYLIRLSKLYKQEITTKAERSTTYIPEVYLSTFLSTIELESEDDYKDSFLAFSESIYPLVIKYAKIKFHFALPRILSRESILSPAQEKIFFSVLFAHYDQFNLAYLILNYLTSGRSGEDLRTMLSGIPEASVLSALAEENEEGNTLLHIVALRPTYLKAILQLYADDTAIIVAMNKKNKYGYTVLHRVAVSRVPLSRSLILLPESSRFAILAACDRENNTVLHRSATLYHAFNDILELLTEDERLLAINLRNSSGDSPLHLVAAFPEVLPEILQLLPITSRLAALSQKNNKGNTPLHVASLDSKFIPASLALLTDNNERRTAISDVDTEGNTLLHMVVSRGRLLGPILNLIPEDDLLVVLNKKNKHGNTVVHLAAQYPEILAQDAKVLLNTLNLYPNHNECLAAMNEANHDGNSLLHLIATIPDLLSLLLQLYPSDSERLDALKKENKKGQTVIDLAAESAESLKIIAPFLRPLGPLTTAPTHSSMPSLVDRATVICDSSGSDEAPLELVDTSSSNKKPKPPVAADSSDVLETRVGIEAPTAPEEGITLDAFLTTPLTSWLKRSAWSNLSLPITSSIYLHERETIDAVKNKLKETDHGFRLQIVLPISTDTSAKGLFTEPTFLVFERKVGAAGDYVIARQVKNTELSALRERFTTTNHATTVDLSMDYVGAGAGAGYRR